MTVDVSAERPTIVSTAVSIDGSAGFNRENFTGYGVMSCNSGDIVASAVMVRYEGEETSIEAMYFATPRSTAGARDHESSKAGPSSVSRGPNSILSAPLQSSVAHSSGPAVSRLREDWPPSPRLEAESCASPGEKLSELPAHADTMR